MSDQNPPTKREIRRMMNHLDMMRVDNLFNWDPIKKAAYESAIAVLRSEFEYAKMEC